MLTLFGKQLKLKLLFTKALFRVHDKKENSHYLFTLIFFQTCMQLFIYLSIYLFSIEIPLIIHRKHVINVTVKGQKKQYKIIKC